MHSAIQISTINDFGFCPYSLYLHTIYMSRNESIYHDVPQINGKAVHANLDNSTYSTRKNILSGMPVFSEKYNIIGKIDIFYIKEGHLVERKFFIKNIFPGHRYQLWAQMFCLQEMGYKVNKLSIRSLKDNQVFSIPKPKKTDTAEFECILRAMRNYLPTDPLPPLVTPAKCDQCIYKQLCTKRYVK